MKNTARKRLGSITVLSLLSLIALVVGVQVALAAASGSTPPAGTQGRGGVSAASTTAFAMTPSAGTQGRGGVAAASASAVARSTPAAGTAGRGGVVALSGPATLAGETTVANNGFSLRARGGVPRPVAGAFAAPSSSSSTVGFGVWVAIGVALTALLAGMAAWVWTRRRGPQAASSLEDYCARHPGDAACSSA
jgi:hypothetical protein